MSFLGNVFKKMTLFDNRKSQRLDAPMLVAYYWDGATPNAHPIRNISSRGFYLLTDERMRPGTVITMTLQRSSPQKVDSASTPHLSVMSMVVRQGEDGIGFTFLPQEPKDSDPVQDPRKPAGRKAIAKFLQQLDTDPGVADGFIAPPIPRRNTPARKPQRFAILLANESGQSLIIAALCTTCLFGFVALAADVGIMLREKRLLQIAADSAAIAGASDFSYGNATTAARAAAAQNGFTNGSGGATVTVNSPPLYGAYAGHAGYVEVIASQNQPTIFMGFFGRSAMAVTLGRWLQPLPVQRAFTRWVLHRAFPPAAAPPLRTHHVGSLLTHPAIAVLISLAARRSLSTPLVSWGPAIACPAAQGLLPLRFSTSFPSVTLFFTSSHRRPVTTYRACLVPPQSMLAAATLKQWQHQAHPLVTTESQSVEDPRST